jgi:hypothetical protein
MGNGRKHRLNAIYITEKRKGDKDNGKESIENKNDRNGEFFAG